MFSKFLVPYPAPDSGWFHYSFGIFDFSSEITRQMFTFISIFGILKFIKNVSLFF